MAVARCRRWRLHSSWCGVIANVFLDISGIPPKTLLDYFPRLQEIATKTLFGTDWPGPGVPEIKRNLDDFRRLDISEPAKRAILSETALRIWPK